MNLSFLNKNIKKLANEQIAPQTAKRDKNKSFPYTEIKQMSSLGLMGMLISEEWGGIGSNHLSLVSAIEEIASADGVCAMLM